MVGFFVAGEMDADGDDGLEAVRAGHGGDVRVGGIGARGVEDQHAEADEGVAEEYGDGEEDHDEEDVDFLAEVAVREGDGEVCEGRVRGEDGKWWWGGHTDG